MGMRRKISDNKGPAPPVNLWERPRTCLLWSASLRKLWTPEHEAWFENEKVEHLTEPQAVQMSTTHINLLKWIRTLSRVSMLIEPTLVFFLSKAFSPAATWRRREMWTKGKMHKYVWNIFTRYVKPTSCLLFLPELLCPVVKMVTST